MDYRQLDKLLIYNHLNKCNEDTVKMIQDILLKDDSTYNIIDMKTVKEIRRNVLDDLEQITEYEKYLREKY